MTKKDPTDYYLHTPAQSSSAYVKWAEERRNSPTVDYGCVMDKYVLPLYPGDFAGFVARPGHCKSSLMAYFAKRTARAIATRGDWDNKCVIYVSWEQPIEELEAFFQSGKTYSSSDLAWNRVSMDIVKTQAIKRVNLPVWLIGYSIGDAGIKKPEFTLDIVLDAIRKIKYEFKRDVVLACFDYLQIIPVPGKRDTQSEVRSATLQLKRLLMETGTPGITGAQAKRGANDMPKMSDCQWGSIIEQTLDKLFFLYKPSKQWEDGKIIDVGGHDIAVDDHLLVIKMLKQRLEKGWGIWPLHFEPEKLILKDYTTVNLNEDHREHI